MFWTIEWKCTGRWFWKVFVTCKLEKWRLGMRHSMGNSPLIPISPQESPFFTSNWGVHLVRAMVFPVVMSRCESWTMKKTEHQRINAFKLWCSKRFESPLDCKIKPVTPKGNQPWIFIGRTDAEAEAPILRPPDVKSQLTGKDPVAGKDWGQEEKWVTGWDGWTASFTQ